MQSNIILSGLSTDELQELIKDAILILSSHRPQQDEPLELLTVNEVAALLKISRVTVFDWKKKGLLPFHRIGKQVRFKKHEVLAALTAVNNG